MTARIVITLSRRELLSTGGSLYWWDFDEYGDFARVIIKQVKP
jgi:hypothetical protein